MRSLLLEEIAAPPAQPARRAAALLASAALHAMVVVTAVLLARGSGDAFAGGAPGAERPVQLLHVPAPDLAPAAAMEAPTPREPRPAPAPNPDPPARPAAAPADRAPEHDDRAGSATPPAERPDQQPPGSDETPSDDAPGDAAPAPSTAELMASEAQRLFGRRRRSTTRAGGPAASPGLEVYLPPQADACGALPQREPTQPVDLVTVSGRVYREGTRIPLPGAHLQMIGTPYVTFSESDGAYELRFDPALVDRCRTQYVRVTAPGFRAQTLVLYLGPAAANDIPMSRR